jgi:hypothetical protein
MKAVILSGMSALALAFTATPAAAQAVVGGGLGGNLGDWNTAGNVNYSTGDYSQSLNASLDRSLSGSSVSGFAGNMKIGNSEEGGLDYAVYGGFGNAGTFIIAGADLAGNGLVFSDSWNGGLYGGLAGGDARIDASFANAGQSSFSSNLSIDFKQKLNIDNFQNLNWNAGGEGDGFGGALAGGAVFN